MYDLDDYEKRWGYVYNMFHRQYMHSMLKDSALGEEGEGTPAKLILNHRVCDANNWTRGKRTVNETIGLYSVATSI